MSAMFVALFALLCSAWTPSEAQTISLGFRRMTATAPWPARYAATVEQLDIPVTAAGVTYPAGSFVLHGGQSSPTTPFSDVWITSSLGSSWTRLAATGYTATSYAGYTRDSASRLYKIGGRTTTGQLSNDVWMSSNGGISWVRQPVTPASRFAPVQSVDVISGPMPSGGDAIYIVGGLQGDATSGPGTNEAWISRDQGATWKLTGKLEVTAPPGRASGSLLSHQPVQRARQTVLFFMGGQGRSAAGTVTYYNDIHISTDNGANWRRIPRNAPWNRRGNFNAEITPSGTMVLTSGFNEDRGTAGGSLNDVWASLDGGFSWGLCSQESPFSDRSFLMTMIDDAGYFYVMGGNEGFNNGSTTRIQRNDVWRSTWSFQDAQTVSRLCGVPVPVCGVGLTCLPGDSNTRYLADGTITCPAIEACKSGRLSFSVVTANAQFPARHSPGFEVYTGKDIRISGKTYKPGSFVVWSGTGPDNTFMTDTWVSTDAVSWDQVPTNDRSTYLGAGWSGHIIDHAGRLFKIGGQRDGGRTGDVYMSTNLGQAWSLQKNTNRGFPLPPREFPDVAVDSQDNLYVVGGLDGDGLNDCWMSSNQGKDWNRRGFLPFSVAGGRSSASLLIYKNPLLTPTQEFMIYMGGMSRAGSRVIYWNDIHVSSNGGIRWVRLTERAPWAERDNFNAEVTGDGVIVLSGGFNSRATYNDVWVTADGGYTWTACLEEAQWSDRRWLGNAMDTAGNLWIIAGDEREGGKSILQNDVWKSSITFRNPKRDLMRSCPAIKLPTCTYGLTCFPSIDTTIPPNKAATCPKLRQCQWPDEDDSTGGAGCDPDDPDCEPDIPSSSSTGAAGSSSSGLSTGALILIAILVIVGVVAIAGYFYYKKKTQKESEFGQEGLLPNGGTSEFATLGASAAPQSQN